MWRHAVHEMLYYVGEGEEPPLPPPAPPQPVITMKDDVGVYVSPLVTWVKRVILVPSSAVSAVISVLIAAILAVFVLISASIAAIAASIAAILAVSVLVAIDVIAASILAASADRSLSSGTLMPWDTNQVATPADTKLDWRIARFQSWASGISPSAYPFARSPVLAWYVAKDVTFAELPEANCSMSEYAVMIKTHS